MKCSCGVPDTDAQPCVHLLCAASKNGIPDTSLFNHDYCTVARWLQQYPQEEEFPVVTFPGLREYVKQHGYTDPADAKLRLPLMGPPPKGRPPKNTRIMGAVERAQKKSVVCSICQTRGHNARGCPKRRA
eukprot:gb/GECG01009759.1/.p1 GENE.gb/GECG01009759.1/~~gb/GECG01009759.1/.p1  ORF type:complete len:130 (+),score=5.85 gb/GECG01009759.1/:1-390(+)